MKKVITKSEEDKIKKSVNEDILFDIEDLCAFINDRNYDYLRFVVYQTSYERDREALFAVVYFLAKKANIAAGNDLKAVAKEVSNAFGCGFDIIIRILRSMQESEGYRGRVDVEEAFGMNTITLN